MSTGLNCEIIEPTPGEWYYVLEDFGAPKNSWDWREYATATGPFSSCEAALEYLHSHEPNPGSHSVISHNEIFRPNYARLLQYARRPETDRSSFGWRL